MKQKERRIVLILIGVVALAILCALTLTIPGFTQTVFGWLGVTQSAAVPTTGVDSPVAIHIIDVGQGDAVLVEDGGEFALMDAGPPEGSDALLAYLKNAGVTQLRYVFMSHPHADHIGGMQAVLERFGAQNVILPDFSLAPYPTTPNFESLLESMLASETSAQTAQMGAEYPLGQGGIKVVHAGLASDDNYNLLSLGLLYQGDGLRFLNTGDGEKANERAMLDDGADLKADLFLAGHHGSSTSNTQAFIEQVNPELVVVSCAAGNSYGHPHKSALKAYEATGARVLRTDKDGSVVVQPAPGGGLATGVGKNRL